MNSSIELVECPRDAMQGWPTWIPTEKKVAYLNALLSVGFDVLDFGSFVSPKAIPQMADTREVLNGLHTAGARTKLLAIIANLRGAKEAVAYSQIHSLGFPFSISETFQLRNTNKTIDASLAEVEAIQQICRLEGKELVVYISMGFGNPFGDEYSETVAMRWVEKLVNLGVKSIALSDTVGVADVPVIQNLFAGLIPRFPEIVFGAHFHSAPHNWEEKIAAAFDAGCRRFDSAMKGIGGCPMATDHLVGNISTENLVAWCKRKKLALRIDKDAFETAERMASGIFL